MLAPWATTAADCPDDLANRTIERLCAQAGAVAAPASRIVHLGLRRNLSHVAAVVTVAACLLLVLGTAIPSFSFLRQHHYRQVCLDQLGGVFESIDLYSSDHDNLLPAVARLADAPWHAIGSQGPTGYSNTRNLYLLLKLGYSQKLTDFICGGARTKATRLEPAQIRTYDDFLSRQDITYSYRLMSDPRCKKSSLASRPLMADMNPHFETVSAQMDVCPVAESLPLNSINHGRRGQNILWGDGHALFSRGRLVGPRADDIYTIENTSTYRGYEWPAGPDDSFMAP